MTAATDLLPGGLPRGWHRLLEPFFVLLGATARSMTGNVAALVANAWYAVETTDGAFRTGLSAFRTLPSAAHGGLFSRRTIR
jgi:hypothetical protein